MDLDVAGAGNITCHPSHIVTNPSQRIYCISGEVLIG